MSAGRLLITVLACLNGGWMVFDGIHAIFVGNFVTRGSGEYEGRLGLWSRILELFGLDPGSTLVKVLFVVWGLLWLAAAVAFALRFSWSHAAIFVIAIMTMWYVPFGTLISLVEIVLLIVVRS
jgi:hypothetical protein